MQHNWPIISLHTIPSTNNYVNELLANNSGLCETVVTAQFQTNGRGQAGNYWESDDGKNLTLSLLLFPQYLIASSQFSLLQSVSLAITDFLKLHGISALIKWPNDIYVNSEKIAGILIENSVMGTTLYHSIVGIGLNVNQLKFSEMRVPATSLSKILNKQFETQSLLQQLLNCIWLRIEQLKTGQLAQIHNDYFKNLYLYGQWAVFSDNKCNFEGKITNVLTTGEIEITMRNSSKHLFLFKEIKFNN
jgi:BirA family biotin operon repressor/biotin-[acetyl-CoA-carboxylase] ligase